MNKRLYIVVIVLTTLSLIGIVVIQGYWIKSAIDNKEDTFTYSIQQVLSVAAKEIEQNEIDKYVTKIMNLRENALPTTKENHLREFIYVQENKDNKEFYIEEFDGTRISIEIDSPAYYRSLTSVLGMVKNIQEINNLSDEEKAKFNGYEIKNIEKTLDKMSGYYALKCRKKNEEEIIVRFNINGMRNNYKLSDLATMSVKLYGIKVGETEGMDIKLDNYFNQLSSQNESKLGIEYKSNEEILKIPVYDILVAGV